jgi:hypothetical protein
MNYGSVQRVVKAVSSGTEIVLDAIESVICTGVWPTGPEWARDCSAADVEILKQVYSITDGEQSVVIDVIGISAGSSCFEASNTIEQQYSIEQG